MTTRTTVGGTLHLRALEALAGVDEKRMAHFHALDRDQQAAAVRRLALIGHSDDGISRATGLAIEQVRRIIGEHK